MGEIVSARTSLAKRRVLIVGQAPGSVDDRRPVTGTMGARLAELTGLERRVGAVYAGAPKDELLGLVFSLANVLDYYPGPAAKGHAFPRGQARAAAARMWPRLAGYDRVLFCGKAVFEAFRTCQWGDANGRRKAWRGAPPFLWLGGGPAGGSFTWMPHPSGIVLYWNDPANVAAAGVFLSDLTRWTMGGVG